MTGDFRDTVKALMGLAKIDLDATEQATAVARIQRVLAHFESLDEVDTDGVEPSTYPLPVPSPLRPDETAAPLPRDAVLGGAPETRADCFRVPRAIDG